VTPPGLAPSRTTLSNGVVVLAKRTRTTPAVTINIAIKAGSVCDPAGTPGAMYLLSRLIDRGTTSRSADDIAETLDSRGISLGITVTRHLFSFFCTCLADIIRRPSLPENELETRKGEVLTLLRQDEDNPGVRATETLMELLYPPPHPYGRRAKGTAAIVEGLTRDRLAALHASRFAPGEKTVVVVGDVDPARAEPVTTKAFGDWTAAPPPPIARVALSRPTDRRRVVIPMMNKAQADIAYGFATIVRTDPEYYACW